MWVVGATTATRETRPSESIRWATWRPKVVLPAAGVAEARKASPSWSKTAAAAACCQARRGRPVGQSGRERPTAGGAGISYVTGRAKLAAGSDEPKRGQTPFIFGWMRGVPVRERGPGWTYRPDMAPPTVYSAHQPGVMTPQLRHALLVAYDADANPREQLEAWTAEAERRMRAGRGTVTIGLGAAGFGDETRPAALRPLPSFPGDALDPALCGGDLCALICDDDDPPEPLPGTLRWTQRGVRTDHGALGFREGTLNLRRPRDFDRHVWVSNRDRSGMLGGTYLVVRRIQVLDSWDALPEHEQEQIIGRDKRTGAPLTGRRLYDAPILDRLPKDAHIRVAAKHPILRRGYDTEDGLLFLAFMCDPRRQFVPLQQRLAERDALHPHTRHIGSAVFAIPPGARPKSFIAQPLL